MSGFSLRFRLDPSLVVLCLVTGVFEEALFRGVMFKGFVRPLATSRHAKPLLRAAVVSSCVFGVLHVSGEVPVSGFDEVVTAQVVLKPLQAALFGFVMAGVFARSRNLWLTCGLHAAFNALSEGPLFLASGYLPATDLTGSVADAVLLAVGSVLLVPAAVKAKAWLVASSRGKDGRAPAHPSWRRAQAMGGKVGFLSNEHTEGRANRL